MLDPTPTTDPLLWPPRCCVPAFVYAALARNGISADPLSLPCLLGVEVSIGDKNPLGLPVSQNGTWGMTSEAANGRINRLFQELGLPLAFRHVPFNEIALESYENVLEQAFSRSVVVGIGLNYNLLANVTRVEPVRHVIRVISNRGSNLKLFDDSLEHSCSEFTVPWDKIERAVLNILDGYWLIGRRPALALDHTLPWMGAA
jgi:hypothetical protein